MAEKEPLHAHPQTSPYYGQPSSAGSLTEQRRPWKLCHFLFNTVKKVEDGGKHAWIKAVKWLHGREFLAEFLATFVLVVCYAT